MPIYIEIAIVNNLAIDLIVCFLTLFIMRKGLSLSRALLASVFGTALALILPLLSINSILTILIKLLCAPIMVCIFFRTKNIKQYYMALMVFLISTFVVGGACFALQFVIFTSSQAPAGAVLAGIVLSVALIRKFTLYFQKANIVEAYKYRAVFVLAGKEMSVEAFLDTGNLLNDPITNLPIVIVSAAALYRQLGEEEMTTILCGRHKLVRQRTINYSTVSGNSKMVLVKPQSFKIYFKDKVNIFNDVMMGISYRGFSKDCGYEMLLNPAAI